jgi:glutaminyl-tRNA synthetase
VLSGFVISPTELLAQINKYITTNTIPGWASLGPVISALKSTPELRWANPLEVKNAVEKAFIDNFGPKEAAKPKGKASIPAVRDTHLVLNKISAGT